MDKKPESDGQGERAHDRKRFEPDFHKGGGDQAKNAEGGEGYDKVGDLEDQRIQAFPKSKLDGLMLFREAGNEKTEEQTEEDQAEQLSFNGCLE